MNEVDAEEGSGIDVNTVAAIGGGAIQESDRVTTETQKRRVFCFLL